VTTGVTAVSDAGAIEDASTTLVEVLEDRIEMDSVDVVLSSPNAVTTSSTPTIGLFLYRVAESPHGDPMSFEEVDPETVRPGPLTVDLDYMVTAYPSGGNNQNQKVQRQHGLLGEAMRALRDAAVVRGSALRGSLESELRISRGDDEETLMDVWNTFPETAYLPSVAYSVGPVSLGAGQPEPAGRVESITRRGDDG
jgi:hypothetical protein